MEIMYRLEESMRWINNCTIKNSYLLSNNNETLAPTIDLYSRYPKIFIDEEYFEITTFTTKFGNYQFKIMPFGLTSTSATFQREINRIYSL